MDFPGHLVTKLVSVATLAIGFVSVAYGQPIVELLRQCEFPHPYLPNAQNSNILACTKIIESSGPDAAVLARALRARARVLAGTDSNAQAVQDIDKAIRLEPSNAEGLYQRALIRRNMADFDGAMSDINQAVALSPGNRSFLFLRATVEQKTRRYNDALNDLNQALAMSPKDDNILSYRCLNYIYMREFQKAKSDCDLAISINGRSLTAWGHRGIANYNMGLFQDALNDFNQVRALDVAFYYGRALARLRLGDDTGATRDFAAVKPFLNRPGAMEDLAALGLVR